MVNLLSVDIFEDLHLLIVDIGFEYYLTLIILEFNYNINNRVCQYTKSCIFGWKIFLEFCTTKVVFYRFGCI
jgi:hypothetical protein